VVDLSESTRSLYRKKLAILLRGQEQPVTDTNGASGDNGDNDLMLEEEPEEQVTYKNTANGFDQVLSKHTFAH